MPGAYAHIAVVNAAQKESDAAGLRKVTSRNLARDLKYLELGAVSPDYPYLALKSGQAAWADNMHYTNTSMLLKAGVATVRTLPVATQARATVWLMGLAAHMATDMTIHPVVELRVGEYSQNKGGHRRCEMHQDAYIFPLVMNVGETAMTEHLASGIATCHSRSDADCIDESVLATWMPMLRAAYPAMYLESLPEPNTWHAGFQRVLGTLGKASHLFPFARHVAADANINYPMADQIDESYIVGLHTPEGPMDYLPLFERAKRNVLQVWKGIDEALESSESKFLNTLEDWNLDTGRSVSTGRHVFWGALA